MSVRLLDLERRVQALTTAGQSRESGSWDWPEIEDFIGRSPRDFILPKKPIKDKDEAVAWAAANIRAHVDTYTIRGILRRIFDRSMADLILTLARQDAESK